MMKYINIINNNKVQYINYNMIIVAMCIYIYIYIYIWLGVAFLGDRSSADPLGPAPLCQL